MSRKLNTVSARDLANLVREEHGLDPEEVQEKYDGYADRIVKTIGKQVSDEMFEQAKEIIYSKALELQIEEESNPNKEITEDEIIASSNIKINKVPGPKRK